MKGRVLFEPTIDRARPFSVDCNGGIATAMTDGSFTVQASPDHTQVLVQTNKVLVALPDTGWQPVTVERGRAVEYRQRWLGKVHRIDVANASAWERGWLIFEDQTLRTVLADVNRYRTGRIILLSGTLGDLRVSGSFDMRNPDRSLEAILATLPIQVHSVSRYLVLLQAA